MVRDVAGARKQAFSAGVTLIVAVLASCWLAFIDIRFAFAPPAVLVLAWAARALGVGVIFPREKIGWLYASVIFVTCWAPSLGEAGTIARFGLAVIVLIVAIVVALSRWQIRPLPTMLTCGLVILVVSLAISTVGAASANYGIARFLNWVMFIPILWLAYQRPNPRGIVFGVIVTGLFQMVGVFLQMAGLMKGTWGGLLTSGTTYNPGTSSWLTRYTSFIANPNNLALLLVCAVIVLAACLLLKLPARLKLCCLALMGVFIYGIVQSGSRGGLVAVALGLIALCLFAGKRGFVLGIVAVSAGLLIAQFAVSKELDRLVESFAEIISGTDASAAQRSGVWVERLQGPSGGLTLGSGFGGYAPSLFADQQGLNVDPEAAKQATVDNSWIKIMLESGLLGALGMALTIVRPMFGSLFKSSGERRIWGIAAGSILVAILWRSVSVDMLDQNPWNAIVFLAVGMAAASFRKGDSIAKSPSLHQSQALIVRRDAVRAR
jgi:O-antigen ligase